MRSSTIAILAAGLLAAPAAPAQTVGIGATTVAYTAQAAAAIAKVVSQDAGIQMRVQPFGGTSAYVPAIDRGTIEFGLANELEATYAVDGTVIYKGRPQRHLRVVTVLTPFGSGLYVRKDSGIRTLKDLKGKRLPSGWASQKIIGVLVEGVLASAGMSMKDVEQVPVPNVVAGANDFVTGRTDAFFFAVGAGKVKEADAQVGGIRALPIETSPEAVKRMRRYVPVAYVKVYKPSPVNTGFLEPTPFMAYDYLMLANDKVADDVVYKVAKAMHDHPQELAAAFPALKLFSPEHMAKRFGHGVTYHPGAIKYYKDIGLWPPKSSK